MATTTKVKPYSFAELKAECEKHNYTAKNSKGVICKIEEFDDTEIRVDGVCYELTYEDFAFYYHWSDDDSHCGVVEDVKEEEKEPTPVAPTKMTQDIFNKYRSLFAFKHLKGALYQKVQICGIIDDNLIIGYQDGSGFIRDFTIRATFDRNTLYSASYDLITCDKLTFID